MNPCPAPRPQVLKLEFGLEEEEAGRRDMMLQLQRLTVERDQARYEAAQVQITGFKGGGLKPLGFKKIACGG